MEKVKKRVYCLYRVSTLKQVEKEDIPMQKQACREFAERQGWEIIEEKAEKGVSGFKVSAKDRDAIQEIQKDAALGKFDILLVFMFDRIGRIDDETPFIVEWFVRNGIEVWSTQEGQQRFDNHVDKLMNYIRYWQASGESIKTSIRTRTRLGQIVEEGRYKGGGVPFGYKLEKQGRLNKKGHEVYEILVDETEAPIVKMIFEKYLHEGYGTYRLASFLNEQGIRNRNDQNFLNVSLQHMLKNITYVGILKSGETHSEIFPELQVIDADTFEQVQKLIEQRTNAYKERTYPLHTKGQGLLSGNLFCGHCGARLVQTSNTRRDRNADGSVSREYVRVRYVCYNKTRYKGLCDGQTGYTVSKVDGFIDKIIHDLFARAKESPQNSLLDVQYNDRIAALKANLQRAKANLSKQQNAYNAYKSEMLKVIQGESALDRETLNELLTESKEAAEMAMTAVERCRNDLENSQAIYSELKEKHESLLSWAEIYDQSSLEARKMIVSQIIQSIRLERNYEMKIDFNISYEEYCRGIGPENDEAPKEEIGMALKHG